MLLQLEEERPQACTGGFGRSVALDGGKEGGGEGGTRGERRGAGEVQIRAMQILSEEVVYQWLTFSSDCSEGRDTPGMKMGLGPGPRFVGSSGLIYVLPSAPVNRCLQTLQAGRGGG